MLDISIILENLLNFFRTLSHGAISRAGAESAITRLPQAAPGITSTSVRPNTIIIFQSR